MRTRNKPVKITREDKLIARAKNLIVDSEGLILEEKKEPKGKNKVRNVARRMKIDISPKKRGVGITRKNKSPNKTKRVIEKNSRRRNRK